VRVVFAEPEPAVGKIRQIYIASMRPLVPLKHGVDRFRKLRAVRFVNATCIDLKVLDVVLGSLLRAKSDFGITRFALACTFQYVFEGDFLVVRSPCVRRDGILRNIVIDESDEAKFIHTLTL
jgi:hypothetical protein